MTVREQSCDSVVHTKWLQEKLLVCIIIHKCKICHNFPKTPFNTCPKRIHHCVESNFFGCERNASEQREQPTSLCVSTISVNCKLLTVLRSQWSQQIFKFAFLKHRCIMPSPHKRSITVCNQTIWGHQVLIFQTVVPLVPAEQLLLTNLWLTNMFDSTIKETPNIAHRCTCSSNCFTACVMVQPRLMDCLKAVYVLATNILQSDVENLAQLRS